jgi:HEPN domain-containing protein
MKTALDHARALLQKAANDLVAAQATLATGHAFDTVCFHAQQAVEKSLKAILALHDVEYPWRHDLGELLELVKPLLPEAAAYEDRIITMTPFAVEIRYDAEFEPSLAQAREALSTALQVQKLIDKVVELHASENKPNQ